MANAAAKRIAAQNAQLRKILRTGTIATNLIHILSLIIFNRYSWSQWFLFLATSGGAIFLWLQLDRMSAPTLDSQGELSKPGEDLSQPGLTQYMLDVVWVTWFVHVTTALISTKFWYTYWIIPLFAGYKAFNLASPFIFGRKDGADSAQSAGDTNAPGQGQPQSKRQVKREKREASGLPPRYKTSSRR